MANRYDGIKNVRNFNGDRFIEDFRRVRDIVAEVRLSDSALKVQKQEVWDEAKIRKLAYYMTDKIYRNRRLVMVIH